MNQMTMHAQHNRLLNMLFGLKGFGYFFIAALWLCNTPTHAFQPSEPLPWSGRISSATECPNEETYALAQGEGFLECLRYFSAGLSPQNKSKNATVLVVLEGDRDHEVLKPIEQIANNTAAARTQTAQKLLARTNVPVIVLSRPGTYGSTGNHRHKRTLKEYAPISAAFDTLAQRYGVRRWAVVGHSGGGTAAAALLTLGRTDLECVVITSGAFDLVERANRHRQNKGLPVKPFTDLTGTRNPYDPLYRLSNVKHDASRKVIVLGDPRDIVTPFEFQMKFAEGLKGLGHNARIEAVEARPPNFHNLKFGAGIKAVNECLASK